MNPNAETVEGERCYPSLGALPEPVGGAVVIVPRGEVEKVVKDAAQAGICRGMDPAAIRNEGCHRVLRGEWHPRDPQ